MEEAQKTSTTPSHFFRPEELIVLTVWNIFQQDGKKTGGLMIVQKKRQKYPSADQELLILCGIYGILSLVLCFCYPCVAMERITDRSIVPYIMKIHWFIVLCTCAVIFFFASGTNSLIAMTWLGWRIIVSPEHQGLRTCSSAVAFSTLFCILSV